MKLKNFRVQNFRSVNDSGLIEVSERTALVGRNESGKTSLLMALRSLNRPGGKLGVLTFVKDFPRDRTQSEFSEDHPVVDTTWTFSEAETRELEALFPRAKGIQEVRVGRPYAARRSVGFIGLPPLAVDEKHVRAGITKIQQSVTASFQGKDAATTEPVNTALGKLSNRLSAPIEKLTEWATGARQAVDAFRQACAATKYDIPADVATELERFASEATQIVEDKEAAAREWVVKRLPVFIYLADYPELEGHQDIPSYLERVRTNNLTDSDQNFGKLMKVAGLDAAELNRLLGADHEQRQLLTNRAGAVVTRKVRELWKDRQLKVRFNLDASHFDTLVSDPESVYDVEINLDERSRGFKWFFSFYVTFAADTTDGPAKDAVLLFDEPALYLHAVAQNDLLEHFKNDFDNTIIYTTHSPFMVPVDDLKSVRTVNISVDVGTTVTNDPTGDSKTLFPLQTALGYALTQTLFIGDKNLVVEGVSDYWYLSSVSEHLADTGGTSLPSGLVVTPAGGAQKVSYMVSLLTSQKLKVLVLLDSESRSKRTAKQDLINTKLIREDGVIFVGDALASSTAEADLEDLLEPSVYGQLVDESYKAELAGKRLALNTNIPRIVRRYEDAFEALGLSFNKMRPARLFLRKIADAPDQVLPKASREKFEKLFKVVKKRLEDLLKRQAGAYR